MGLDPWFTLKAYGYGASPANWKGWAATGVFCAITLVLGLVLIGPDRSQPDTGYLVAFFVVEAFLLVGFVWLVKVKTAGEWRWRWGDKK